jgi:hypothetical protein
MPKKTCFIIGPIGPTGSPEREHANTFLKYIVEQCAALTDYQPPIRADLITEPGQITTQIIGHLLHDDLVIADLTGHNPNVFYELSLRHAIGKPVVQMGGIPLPFDVHTSRTIPFSFDVREADEARRQLADQIGRINTSGYQAANLITEAAPVIQIAKTGPSDIAGVLRAVQDLASDVRLLAAEVQLLKQRGAPFVSLPTGPTGAPFAISPSLDGTVLLSPRASTDAKLAAAGAGYTPAPYPFREDPTGPTGSSRAKSE